MNEKKHRKIVEYSACALFGVLIGVVSTVFFLSDLRSSLNQDSTESRTSSLNTPIDDSTSSITGWPPSNQIVDEIPYFEFVDEGLLPESDGIVNDELKNGRAGGGFSLSRFRETSDNIRSSLRVVSSQEFPASFVRERTFILELDPVDVAPFERKDLLFALSDQGADTLLRKRVRVNSVSFPQSEVAVFSDSSGDILLKGRTDSFDSILLLFREGGEQKFYVRRLILSVDCEQIPAIVRASHCSDNEGIRTSTGTVIDISRAKVGENWQETPNPVRFPVSVPVATSDKAPAESRAFAPYIDRYECKNEPLEPLVRPVFVFLFSRDDEGYLDDLVPMTQSIINNEFGPGVIEVKSLKIDNFDRFPGVSPKSLLSTRRSSLPISCVLAEGEQLCEWLERLKELAFRDHSDAQFQDQWRDAVETALFFDISDRSEGTFPSGKVAQIPATPGGANIGYVQPTSVGNHISDTAFVLFHEVGHLLGLQHQHPSVSTAYADFRDGRILRNRPLESAPKALKRSGGECGWFNWWGCRSHVIVTAMYDQNMMPIRLSKSSVAETFGGGAGPCAKLWYSERELEQAGSNASPIMVAYRQAKALSSYDSARATENNFSGKYAWPRFYEERYEPPARSLPQPGSAPVLSFDCPRIDPLEGMPAEVNVGDLLATFDSGSAEHNGSMNFEALRDIDIDQPIRLIAFSDGVGDNGDNFILSYRRLWTIVSALEDTNRKIVTACIAGENLLPKQGASLRSANCELNGTEEDQCRRAVYLRQ